jgi:hypothetical protein
MGYLHIGNLYKEQDILLFKECYAMEKIHGTSAHIAWSEEQQKVSFFSGGEKYLRFIALFNEDELKAKFIERSTTFNSHYGVTIFGEAYGASQQGMRATYGDALKFIAFDVKIGNFWLDVPRAEKFCEAFGIEFVHYVRIPATLEEIDKQRDADSVQAVRNGMGPGHKREGVVLRPIVEFVHQGEHGGRIICKHKNDEFRETATPRKVDDPEKLKALEEACEIADEFVVTQRLLHVLDKIPDHSMEKMRDIINAMVEDVIREGKGEIIANSNDVVKAIGKKTAKLYKEYLQSQLKENKNGQTEETKTASTNDICKT